jgi:GST-like protein
MAGQAHFFLRYAPQKVPFAMDRFRGEVARLYTVLDKQLGRSEYLAGEYSIADIAAWPWVARWEWQEQNLEVFPNVKRWFAAIGERPAVQRALAVGADWANFNQQMSAEDKKRLFNLRDQDFGAARD